MLLSSLLAAWVKEWVYRILCAPKKQLKRCSMIILTLPRLLFEEYRRRAKAEE